MRASVRRAPTGAELAATVAEQIWRVARLVERRAWWVVAAAVLADWAFVAREALDRIPHNGWVYQHGNDGPWYWTSGWTLSSLHVPDAIVGLGWPYLLSPFAAIFGPDMANGMPAVIALDVLVLAPTAVVGMFLLGEKLAGRLFGVWTVVLWVVLPPLGLALYHTQRPPVIVETFLPSALGLNALADYPSMVCAIFAAYLVLRCLDSDHAGEAVLCGLVLGFLVLLKPANGPLPVAAAIALIGLRRWRALATAAAAMVPALVALVVWKDRGTGRIPLFALPESHQALGASPTVGAIDVHTYLRLDWHQLALNAHALSEVFWSLRALEFLLVAGSFGLIARLRWRGAFVVLWFVIFGIVKGSSPQASIYDTSAYRLLLPAWPAWVLIVAGVALCWPRVRTPRASVAPARWHPGARTLAFAAVLLALGPLALTAAASPIDNDDVGHIYGSGPALPIVDFELKGINTGKAVTLTWRSQKPKTEPVIRYAVFKGRDDGCRYIPIGPPACQLLAMTLIGATAKTMFTDTQPLARAFYRVALVSGPRADPDNPDALLLSMPVEVSR